MPGQRYDVVIVSDLRLPGGTSSSIVEEIKAQAKAGYSTGLVHVPIYPRARPFNAKIRRCLDDGLARLVVGGDRVETRLLLIRPPRAFERIPPPISRITADRALVIVNQVPADASRPEPYYDVPAIAENAIRSLGPEVVWAPIGPLARNAMAEYRTKVTLADRDWVNIIDVDEWTVPRDTFVADRPVIGRHSRRDNRKWPESPQDILAAYPERDSYRVMILGGAEVPQRMLRRIPNSWTIFPFDAVSSREFLAHIDFYVYFHHSGLAEAFGRGILEALSSGAVVIVPAHFRALFGDACVYAEPSGVTDLVDRFYEDHEAYREQSRRGTTFVRENFGQAVHTQRLEHLIGAPSVARKTYRICDSTATRRALFVTSNGGGLGHLTRLMAVARRLSRDIQPVFFTLSTGFPIVQQEGWPVEYMASFRGGRWHRSRWHELFRMRLQTAIDAHRPDIVVFDGTNPYDGLLEARRANPHISFVWSRRGMWKAGMNEDVLEKSEAFDLVIEPGDFAASVDVGATTRDTRPVTKVKPILLLDSTELLDACAAKSELGLDFERPAALVQLRVGSSSSTGDIASRVIARLVREGLQVCVAQAFPNQQATEGVRYVSVFPISKYFRAFEFGITASGYNSYHEAIGFGLPTVFVPKPDPDLDDQSARARYAQEVGVGLCVDPFDEATFDRCIVTMREERERRRMADRCRELFPGNGAAETASALEAMMTASARRRQTIPTETETVTPYGSSGRGSAWGRA